MKQLDLPPVWTALCILASWAIARFLPDFGLSLQWRHSAYPIAIVGVGLIIWAVVTFRHGKTTIHPGHEPSALLTNGPFAFSRNPIYTGMVMVSLSAALYLGPVLSFLPVIALFFILDRRFARPEESKLIETFGAKGADYVERVRRW